VGGKLVLNETYLSAKEGKEAKAFIDAVAQRFGWLAKQDIAVVSDDDIVGLVNRSMLVQV
jgi:hypothetical protein